jgi:hypothetical protein
VPPCVRSAGAEVRRCAGVLPHRETGPA